jgi:small subunit ribosomal protein S20
MPAGTPTKVKKRKKSVLKRNRQTISRSAVNRANRTQVRSAIRRMRAALGTGDAGAAQQLISPTFSAIDQAIRKGVLKENTGNRYKSRLTLAYNALRAGGRAGARG